MAEETTQPLVSAIVLNWNGEAHLAECLASLVAQSYSPLEVIVADNGSADGSRGEVERWPSVRWLPLGTNHGFARGNNLGARHASGEIVVFVNNDMRFAPDFVELLAEPLAQDPEVFATDARQRDWGDSLDIHEATSVVKLPLHHAFGGHRTPLPGLSIKQTPSASPRRVVQACAGNMAVRRWMFEALGGFDGRMKAGWEDTDLCWTAWLRDWSTVYVPSAVCWHKVGATSRTPEGRSVRRRGEAEGRLIFAVRHLPAEVALVTWLATGVSVARDLLRRDGNRARVSASALFQAVAWLGPALGERHRMYRVAGSSPRRHLDRLVSLSRTG